MKNALESLENFYRQCDLAPIPTGNSATGLLSKLGIQAVHGLVPFFVAFAFIALLMPLASEAGTSRMPESTVAFPKMLKSAGLSQADLRNAPMPRQSSRSGITWHA